MRQDEGLSLPPDAKLFFEVAKDMPKVDVEKLAILHNHNVVRVTVSYSQDVGGHTVPSTGQSELMDCLVK